MKAEATSNAARIAVPDQVTVIHGFLSGHTVKVLKVTENKVGGYDYWINRKIGVVEMGPYRMQPAVIIHCEIPAHLNLPGSQRVSYPVYRNEDGIVSMFVEFPEAELAKGRTPDEHRALVAGGAFPIEGRDS